MVNGNESIATTHEESKRIDALHQLYFVILLDAAEVDSHKDVLFRDTVELREFAARRKNLLIFRTARSVIGGGSGAW